MVNARPRTPQIPGKDGYMGILPGHAALLSELGDGTLSITSGGPPKASMSPADTSKSATITCASRPIASNSAALPPRFAENYNR